MTLEDSFCFVTLWIAGQAVKAEKRHILRWVRVRKTEELCRVTRTGTGRRLSHDLSGQGQL